MNARQRRSTECRLSAALRFRWLAVPLLLGAVACSTPPRSSPPAIPPSVAPAAAPVAPEAAPSAADPVAAGRAETARFLVENRSRLEVAIDRTMAYLDHFQFDPLELEEYGIKGRKKLVELLDAYVAIHRNTGAVMRATAAEAFGRAAATTERPTYHNMGSVDDEPFRVNATSYLRACYLMDKMGHETAEYRRQIAKIGPRLDAHFPERGPHQRMVFRFYYRHFGLPVPPILEEPLPDSVIGRRLAAPAMSLDDAYNLTHEIFVPYDFGGDLAANPFSDDERAYLRGTLDALAKRYLEAPDVDILGEILADIRYLGFQDLPVYRSGLEFLLASQRPTGAFGDYEKERAERGHRVEIDFYLHTTSVVMDVLPLAFADASAAAP